MPREYGPVTARDMRHAQELRFYSPHLFAPDAYKEVYERGIITVGWPEGVVKLLEGIARENTAIVVGAQLGDEGKGRIIDNLIEDQLSRGMKVVHVIRFQGGSNAGHTVTSPDGKKVILHQVPSGILYEKTVGYMDRGMTIHPEDLQTEVEAAEENSFVGDLRGKLVLSRDAILCTDLERAEELLNRKKEGKSSGGTGRGIGPSYAHHYDKTGLHIHDLLDENWRDVLGDRYERYQKEFQNFSEEALADILVPDLRETKRTGKAAGRRVGTKEEFLDRLETARTWLIDREMVQNTVELHRASKRDVSQGILFEAAQAVGLHPWLGTLPDVTSSDTSPYGVAAGTGLWRPNDILDKIGVIKLTYQSSVGARSMPTGVPLKKSVRSPNDLGQDANAWERWAAGVRDTAQEFGSTTGRPRDICFLDIPLLQYNAMIAEIDSLAGTHLDIAKEGEIIRVCTHYTDKNGTYVPYQPGLQYQRTVVPHYMDLPGWDGAACRNAASFHELPENAKKFLAFLQNITQIPIIAATTGPARENYVRLKDN